MDNTVNDAGDNDVLLWMLIWCHMYICDKER